MIDDIANLMRGPNELSSGDFAGSHIVAIEQQLAEAVTAERDLSELRTRLLLDGNETQLDDCERKLERSRITQLRAQERIALIGNRFVGEIE